MAFDITPNKLESVYIQRDASNQYYEQINVSGSNVIVYHDSDGKLTAQRIQDWMIQYGVRQSYYDYTTLSPNASNWFTCSFQDYAEFVPLTSNVTYRFTHSNAPTVGKMSDLTIVISCSAVLSSSVSFPPQWKCLNGMWPTMFMGSTITIISLKAVDTNLVLGTINPQPIKWGFAY